MLGTEVVDGDGDGRLEALTLRDDGGEASTVPADALFVMIGARPGTEWLPPEIERDGGTSSPAATCPATPAATGPG